jgi:hypothetical protein
MMTAVISPVCGFVISQRGFFIWLAVRPRDFVWPGLKVTETESEVGGGGVGGAVFLGDIVVL